MSQNNDTSTLFEDFFHFVNDRSHAYIKRGLLPTMVGREGRGVTVFLFPVVFAGLGMRHRTRSERSVRFGLSP